MKKEVKIGDIVMVVCSPSHLRVTDRGGFLHMDCLEGHSYCTSSLDNRFVVVAKGLKGLPSNTPLGYNGYGNDTILQHISLHYLLFAKETQLHPIVKRCPECGNSIE